MVFYKIDAKRVINKDEREELTRQERHFLSLNLCEKSESLFHITRGQGMVATVFANEDTATFVVIARSPEAVAPIFEKYKKMLPFALRSHRSEEITFSVFEDMLACADHNNNINDAEEILKRFEIYDLNNNRGYFAFGESIVDDTLSVKDCKEIAKGLLFESTVNPELDRIHSHPTTSKSTGHPVHYLLTTDDRDIRKTVYKLLLASLYNNGRLKNKRYSFVDYNGESRLPGAAFEALYRSSEGGAVVIRYTDSDEAENGFSKRSSDVISALCETATKYKNKTLTILCIPKNASKIKEEFMMHWGSTAFVELHEGIAFGTDAESYLKAKAKEQKTRSDKKLMSYILPDKSYTSSELNIIFDEWYSRKLRNEIYPQYKATTSAKSEILHSHPRGSAYERLEVLIGLDNAKEVMNTALNYYKAQKLFAHRGMIAEHPSMHMVFTGNPGTAKTTVARLFAEIMRDNSLLPNGEIYEVGRADLVGKYVGSTAPLVKSAFKRAKGGVLFIDEAYSLVDDRDGLFGDEAINTIVQEMENNRGDTIVIFAGYPDKMEKFLRKNPGLRSRIAFHIPFDDYSPEDLLKIAQLIAREKNLTLSPDALQKLKTLFTYAVRRSDFGNGRFVRNTIEKAKMAQANRLMKMDIEKISDDDLKTLVAEDIETHEEVMEEKTIKLGFSA